MFRGVGKLNVRTCKGGGDTSRTYESLQGREGPKLDEIERTYFLNGRFPHPLSMEVVYITCLSISYECQFMPLVKSMITCSHLKKKIVKLLFHKINSSHFNSS